VSGSTPASTYKASLLSSLVQGLAGEAVPKPVRDVAAYRIRYTTQDRGKLIEATAAVALPSEPTEAPLDVVAVLHGTAGFTDGCGPSKDSDAVLLLAYVASLGYIAVGPDYLGLRGDDQKTGFPHPYLAGQPTAIASLDAIRAAGRLAESQQLCPSARYAILGGSQGGHAALWVDRLAPYYAPELELRGVTATVPPADLLGQAVRALQEPVSASANTAAMLAVTPDWYGHGDKLAQALVPPRDTELPKILAESCDPEKAVSGLTTLEEVFQPALLDAAKSGTLGQQQPFGCILAENGLTTTSIPRINPPSPSYGVLFVLGEKDALVHTPIERVAYETLCKQGLPLAYLECAGASHTKATTWALPEILKFTAARFAGEAFSPSCQVAPPSTCQGTPASPLAAQPAGASSFAGASAASRASARSRWASWSRSAMTERSFPRS
jgi:dienelactone hydrolase